MEKTIIEALDERELVKARIEKALRGMIGGVGIKVHSESTLENSPATVEEFNKDIVSRYQSLKDLIERFNTINTAIAAANAKTPVTIQWAGHSETMSVAEAIALRDGINRQDYTARLANVLESALNDATSAVTVKNNRVRLEAQQMATSIVGKNAKDNAALNTEALKMSTSYYENHSFEIVDPLDLKNTISDIVDENNERLAALKVAIKIANATTKIEI